LSERDTDARRARALDELEALGDERDAAGTRVAMQIRPKPAF
jgi:hypothetical protein